MKNLTDVQYNVDDMGYDVISHKGRLDVSQLHSTAIHRVKLKDTYIDLLIKGFDNLSADSSVLVCFTAAIMKRETKVAPFFSGVGVSNKLDIPIISIADPTVSDYLVGLAWYAGNERTPGLQYEIAKLLCDIQAYFQFKQYILLGGSGAGFACLTQLMLVKNLKLKALVMNPQTSVLEYFLSSVKRYVTQAFKSDFKHLNFSKESARKVLEKNNINFEVNVNEFDAGHELVYLQNASDSHVDTHLLPFLKQSHLPWLRHGACSFSYGKQLALFVGNWGKGHAPPPKELVFHIIQGFIDGKSPLELAQSIEDRLVVFENVSEFYDNQVFGLKWNLDHVVKDSDCKVHAFSPVLKRIEGIEFAFYLILDGKNIISKQMYESSNQHVFSIKDLDIHRLSIRSFVRFPNGNKMSIVKKLS